MEFKLNDFHYNTPEEDFISDIQRVARQLQKTALSMRDYDEVGKYTSSTIYKRFGSWNIALQNAGLDSVLQLNVSDKELFENIESVWISLGRQPTHREMKRPLSKFSTYPYARRFGTYRKALLAFIEFINAEKDDFTLENTNVEQVLSGLNPEESTIKHKTKRTPSERLKVQVLMRDGNKCRLCGITVIGGSIHFDHIKPWSKGGETTLENLQVLCEKHNLAKGNLDT